MDTSDDRPTRGGSVDVHLDDAERNWLVRAGARELPPLGPSGMLKRLLERAMADADREAGRRAYQLEVYRVSGYAEHHPDYPNRASSDAEAAQ